MFTTKTGGFPIGFRRGWSDWQKNLNGLITWAKANQLGVIDLGSDGDTSSAVVSAAGLRIGSVDLKEWSGVISKDPAKREAAVAANDAYIEAATANGATNFFAVMLPDDAARPRSENFVYMVDGLKQLSSVMEKYGAKLVIEGWPGAGALCCTPESYRETIKAVGSKAIGINYDPSHLIRMGIDPIRFLEEFAGDVYHVHGKDTEIFSEAVYEYGTEQEPTHGKGHDFGSAFWRYTIPGHGQMRWKRAFEILVAHGYQGAVSIELEDENFNGSETGEKAGLIAGGHFLANC